MSSYGNDMGVAARWFVLDAVLVKDSRPSLQDGHRTPHGSF